MSKYMPVRDKLVIIRVWIRTHPLGLPHFALETIPAFAGGLILPLSLPREAGRCRRVFSG